MSIQEKAGADRSSYSGSVGVSEYSAEFRRCSSHFFRADWFSRQKQLEELSSRIPRYLPSFHDFPILQPPLSETRSYEF